MASDASSASMVSRRSIQWFDFDDLRAMIASGPESERRCGVIHENSPDVGRARQQIINHLAGSGVQTRHLVRNHRAGPRLLVSVEGDIVGRCPARTELPLLELFGPGVEHSDAIAPVFAEPQPILCVHTATSRRGARRGNFEQLDLAGYGVDASDMLLTEIGEIGIIF